MFRYLTLPMEPGELTRKKTHGSCSLKQSVAQNLHLIITTAFGELISDPDFGTTIWDAEFSNITFNSRQKETILDSLKKAIGKYEKRIENIKINLEVQQDELATERHSQMKKKLSVQVTSVLKLTNESIVYNDSFFIGPLAYN